MMITPGTDAKAMGLLGIPTYGFAPLRLDADVPFLEEDEDDSFDEADIEGLPGEDEADR